MIPVEFHQVLHEAEKMRCSELRLRLRRRIADTLSIESQHVPNYLRESDGAAERHGYPNVVAHPQVDGVDAAAHVDLLVQGFTLMHRGRRRRRRVELEEKKEVQIF